MDYVMSDGDIGARCAALEQRLEKETRLHKETLEALAAEQKLRRDAEAALAENVSEEDDEAVRLREDLAAEREAHRMELQNLQHKLDTCTDEAHAALADKAMERLADEEDEAVPYAGKARTNERV